MRGPCVDKNGMKKGSWSEEEDTKLRSYILRYGHWNWRLLPKFAGLARCGKSCRLRWVNYLKPGLKRGNYTKEEEHLIIKLHHQLGNKWSAITAKLPGRTDNEIKNYWHTHLKKRSQCVGTMGSNSVCNNSSESVNLQGFDVPILESSGSESKSQNPCPLSWDSEDSTTSLCEKVSVAAKTCTPCPVSWDSEDSTTSLCEKVSVVAENCTTGRGFFHNERESSTDSSESLWTEQILVDTIACIQAHESFPVLSDENWNMFMQI